MEQCLEVKTKNNTLYLKSVNIEIFQVKGISTEDNKMKIIPIEDIISIKSHIGIYNINIISLN